MNILPFRVARQAAFDDPADLALAQKIHAPHAPLPLSRSHEQVLREIREHESAIGRHAQAIRWLKLSMETEHG